MTSPLADDQAVLIIPDGDVSGDLVRAWTWEALFGVPSVPRLRMMVVVDELVSNACEHGRAPCVLRLSLDHTRRYLLVFVDDSAADDGTVWQSSAGLMLVEGLTSDWSVDWRVQGKTVWAEIPLGMRFPTIVVPPQPPPDAWPRRP